LYNSPFFYWRCRFNIECFYIVEA